MKAALGGPLAAIQFLTRIPVPGARLDGVTLAQAAPSFPLVGALLGLAAGGIDVLLRSHLSALAAAGGTVLFLVAITGGLHEDGLADTADGLGGARSPERALAIMRDSRIGSYGAIALSFSILVRCVLIAALPRQATFAYLIAAETLSRWSVLPLAYFLPCARGSGASAGQGARLARSLSPAALMAGTVLAVAVTIAALHSASALPWVVCLATCLVSGLYFRRRIGGVTGDCFGATIQLVAAAVYVCGAWR